jgi:hypothetical protein
VGNGEIVGGNVLTKAQSLDESYAMFYTGQRMQLPETLAPGVYRHEYDDSRGRVYHTDGTVTGWYRNDMATRSFEGAPWNPIGEEWW